MSDYDEQEEQEKMLAHYDRLQMCWFNELMSDRPDWILLGQLHEQMQQLARRMERLE